MLCPQPQSHTTFHIPPQPPTPQPPPLQHAATATTTTTTTSSSSSSSSEKKQQQQQAQWNTITSSDANQEHENSCKRGPVWAHCLSVYNDVPLTQKMSGLFQSSSHWNSNDRLLSFLCRAHVGHILTQQCWSFLSTHWSNSLKPQPTCQLWIRRIAIFSMRINYFRFMKSCFMKCWYMSLVAVDIVSKPCTKFLFKAATKHCLRFGPGMQSEYPKWSKTSRSWIQKQSSTRFLTPAMSVLPITPAAFVHVAPPASMRRSRTNIFPQKMASSQWCYSRLMVQSTYATSTFGKLSVWPPLRSPTFSACQRCDAAWFGCSSRCNSSTRLKAKSHQWVVLLFLTNWGKKIKSLKSKWIW